MAARKQRLTPKTIEVLNSAYVEGTSLRLTCGQLPPRQFAQPKAVIEAIGGIWSMATGAYTFPYGSDPAALLAAVIEAGTVPLAAKTAEGYVRTPDQVATDVLTYHVDAGHLPRGARVLEPSAGDGAIVRAILDSNRDVTVVAVEPQPDRVAALRMLATTVPGHLEVHAMTLEEFAADPDAHGEPFDAVIMNPPFFLPGEGDAVWLAHVRTAYRLMGAGAQLAAIVPTSYQFRSGTLHRDFRAEVEACCGTFKPIDRDAFAPSGCGVSAGVLTYPKPLPVPADGLPVWLARPPIDLAPVPVREWNLGASGVATMPVQIGRHLGQENMVLRFAGQCFGCARLLWQFDERGGACVWEACSRDADECGKVGPSALLCLECYSGNADAYERALAAAMPYWTDQPADAPRVGPKVYPMDIGAGNWVTVTGLDPRGWECTATGQVIAEPVYIDADDRVTVVVRGVLGVDFELSVHADSHVIVFDGAPAPEDAKRAAPIAEDADHAPTAERWDAKLCALTADLPATPTEPEPEPAPVKVPGPAPFVSGWTQDALLPLPV